MREPDARDAARVLALALLVLGAAMLLAHLGLPPFLSAVLLQGSFFGLPLLYARLVGVRPFAFSGFARLSPRQAALVLVASIGSFWLLYGLSRVQMEVIRAAGYEKQAQEEERQINRGIESARNQGALPALALLVLIPPLCEETFFRGILLRGLASRFGLAVALGGTSLLFSAFHGTLVQKGLMIALGCYFGALVHLTGSLWASILAHAVNNLAVLTMTWIYGTELPEFSAPWWIYGFSGVVFVLGLAALALERQRGVHSLP
jgi:membrane protease YdiL (CAAX protease family)